VTPHPTHQYFVTASMDKTWAFYDADTASCLVQVIDLMLSCFCLCHVSVPTVHDVFPERCISASLDLLRLPRHDIYLNCVSRSRTQTWTAVSQQRHSTPMVSSWVPAARTPWSACGRSDSRRCAYTCISGTWLLQVQIASCRLWHMFMQPMHSECTVMMTT
jgi:hypothetical protein